jgi:hypothetical protein
MKTTAIVLVLSVAMLLLVGCSSKPPTMTKLPTPPSPSVILGSDKDAHGCIGSAGYSWCDSEQKCYRPWEENCAAMPGSDRDAHGCIPSAGYSWCENLQSCIRPWETDCATGAMKCASDSDCPPGAARCANGACTQYDEHGCVPDGGYSWCEEKGKCLRIWEETCNAAGRLAKAQEHCSDASAAQVSVCGDYIKVVSSLIGGGSAFYTDNGTEIRCPLVAPDAMTEQCSLLMMGSNCVEQIVDCSSSRVPGAVTDLADDPSFVGAQLTWSAPDSFAVDYEIFRGNEALTTVSLIKTTAQTSYKDIFNGGNATYAYFVRAKNANGAESPSSNIVYVQQLSTSDRPSPGQIS